MNMAQAEKQIKEMKTVIEEQGKRIAELENATSSDVYLEMTAYSNLILAQAAVQDRSGWSNDSHELGARREFLEKKT